MPSTCGCRRGDWPSAPESRLSPRDGGHAPAGRAGHKRYWAFLSYSHADRGWARWLHRAIEGYVLPRRLLGRPTAMGPAPRRLRPV
jgi:hypothetical protein